MKCFIWNTEVSVMTWMGVCTSMCKAGSGQKSSWILAPGILALVGGMGVPNANTFSSLQHQDWKYLKWTFFKDSGGGISSISCWQLMVLYSPCNLSCLKALIRWSNVSSVLLCFILFICLLMGIIFRNKNAQVTGGF